MKKKDEKNTSNKFNLEKFEVAKLKKLYLIKGGKAPDDPIDGTGKKGVGSSGDC